MCRAFTRYPRGDRLMAASRSTSESLCRPPIFLRFGVVRASGVAKLEREIGSFARGSSLGTTLTLAGPR